MLDVYVTRRTISGDGPSTYQMQMQIQNVHRGNLKTGRSLEAFGDGAQPKVGDQYIIMGRVKDGWFHVDPTIQLSLYPREGRVDFPAVEAVRLQGISLSPGFSHSARRPAR
ncbi:hypothetical protein DYH09_12670 [bacterium CPR1]|nr:hypothetical protein [bacterium CPR1]